MRLIYVNSHFILLSQELDEVEERADDIMQAFDTNQDGILDANEVVRKSPSSAPPHYHLIYAGAHSGGDCSSREYRSLRFGD
jgi:hypothetical protein